MRRRFDDEDERPGWGWRLTKGALMGLIVSTAGAVAISLFVLPPPSPPPAETAADAAPGEPTVIDGIEVSTEPAYFGAADTGDAAGDAAGDLSDDVTGGPTGDVSLDVAADDAGTVELSGPALSVNAAPFEAAPDEPLVAVVLDNAAANPLLHETLFALGIPVTIGVVAGGAGDRVTGRMAREAGYEVVAELPLVAPGQSEGAMLEYDMAESDAAERTMLLMRRLPMAVAVTLPLEVPVPPEGAVLSGILDALGPLGFAYLEHSVAPDAEPALASDGIERIVAVSRFSIPAGASAAEAHAILDRASAVAEETGAAVVMASAEENVLLAVQLWGDDDAVGQARLAPLSAVVRRQNGGDALPEPAAEPEAAAEPDPAATDNSN